ncbi:hypothetical protein, partial [Desulfobacter sp.]|uniref:hypothetical protein n=1 Tax=Desulfobacter sp. TaxID=2294 RepID=UPI003D0B97A4
ASGFGAPATSTQVDMMGGWKAFRDTAGGLTNKTMDLAIAKKINDAKAGGIPFEKINFTDAERSRVVGGTNGGGANADPNRGNRLDWIEGKDGRKRYFDQNGREVAFNPPPGRADFSGLPSQLRVSHERGAGATQSASIPAASPPKQESEPYAEYTNIRPGVGKFSNIFWGTDSSGKTRRIDFERPVLPSGLPNPEFLKRTAFREKIGYPQTEKEQEAYRTALERLKNIQYIKRDR